MKLKAIYDSQDEVPEQYADLYSERDGRFELTGVEGVKTQADVDRLQTALGSERDAHKATRTQLRQFTTVVGDRKPEDVQAALDEVEELRAKVEAGTNTASDDERLEKLLQARLPAKLRPLERERDTLRGELDTTRQQRDVLLAAHRQRLVHDAIEEAVAGEKGIKVIRDAIPDVRMLAENVMDVDFDNENRVFVREGAQGFTPGLSLRDWLADIQQSGKRRHWFEENVGAGARGGSSTASGRNPFKEETFNLTECGRIARENPARAMALAKAAGREDLLKHLTKN